MFATHLFALIDLNADVDSAVGTGVCCSTTYGS